MKEGTAFQPRVLQLNLYRQHRSTPAQQIPQKKKIEEYASAGIDPPPSACKADAQTPRPPAPEKLGVKGELHAKPKVSMFYALFQSCKHFFAKLIYAS